MYKYKTVMNDSEIEIIEKKSRFISHVKYIENEDDAHSFILSIKKKHYNASHNVFAYRCINFGYTEIERCSDDGEPTSTAGLPMLDFLRKEGVQNVVVVVTRYFGGTLLGTGGLTRAYRNACKNGIDNAIIIEKKLYQKISIQTNYNLAGKVQYEILQANYIIFDTVYSDMVEYIVLVDYQNTENFVKHIIDITNNGSNITYLEKLYSN